jgi:dihydropteroate synthase
MPDHVLFLTGDLAEPRLRRVLDAMAPLGFRASVANVGVKVAALMTTEIVLRRLPSAEGADLVMLPGRFRGDLERLGSHFGTRFERGPDEIDDLPAHFKRAAVPVDLSRYETSLFAEIVDAPRLGIPEILAEAARFRADGADVVDLGCLPDTPFPHLEEAIAALRAEGHRVSVDSLDPADLMRGQRAGADYLLSLTEETLWVAGEGPATPILIPATPGDLPSLLRAAEALAARGRRFVADPVLDPIHHGFTASLLRYHAVRERLPEAEILMGIGNVTELTDADTTGVNAILMGIVSELRIQHVLAVQVSPHCRRAIREFDAARRQFLAARELGSTPRNVGAGLLCLRDRRPFPTPPAGIAETAAMIRDRNYRIEVGEDGIHAYNRDGHHVATDPFRIYPHLDVAGDAGHAFYLGVETARAEIAWQLGKRYAQDSGLRWGVAVDTPKEDLSGFHAVGPTKAGKAGTPAEPARETEDPKPCP